MENETTTNRIIRLKEVQSRTGLSRSTIYAWMNEKKFPVPVQLGARAVGWNEAEIQKWIKSLQQVSDGGKNV